MAVWSILLFVANFFGTNLVWLFGRFDRCYFNISLLCSVSMLDMFEGRRERAGVYLDNHAIHVRNIPMRFVEMKIA